VGYGAGPLALMKQIGALQSHSTSNACSISQEAALAALQGSLDFLDDWRVAFKRRRDLVVSKLNAIDGITCKTPEGAFYVFPSCAALVGKTTPAGKKIENDLDVAAYLLEDALCAVVPGSAFGAEGYFRISYATSDAALEEACSRIADAIAKLT